MPLIQYAQRKAMLRRPGPDCRFRLKGALLPPLAPATLVFIGGEKAPPLQGWHFLLPAIPGLAPWAFLRRSVGACGR